ncbi:MAG: ATP synthase F1 subunit gamma [Ruminococcaceae bacterium]|nr:ATP synthase F1 subunit gamma [Oscillospiraceae bacterium]
MGANIKQIRSRIKSVDSTLHITKAMQLVASSKVRRAKLSADGAAVYADAMRDAFLNLVSRDTEKSIFVTPPKIGVTCYLLIAGDRGLAGGYNGNLFRLATAEAAGRRCVYLPIGKRAADFCQRQGLPTLSERSYSSEKLSDLQLSEIAALLCDGFRAHQFDAVKVIHTELLSVLSQEAVCTTLLPLPVTAGSTASVTVYEPDSEALMQRAVADYLTASLAAAVRESFLCELYARRNAMDSATKNAEEMIDALNLQYNRARQSSITQEITEIVAGAEGQQ